MNTPIERSPEKVDKMLNIPGLADVRGLSSSMSKKTTSIPNPAHIPSVIIVQDNVSKKEFLSDNKIENWKNQLLDLSKRNRMINYRQTKRTTLKILEPDLTVLFNRLAINNEELKFQRPINMDSDRRTYFILSLMEAMKHPIPARFGDMLAEGSMPERRKTLRNLRAKAKLSIDEQGTNILYLSFGFIQWKEKTADTEWIKSPLILVPVSLKLESINAPYALRRYDDDIEVNPTLTFLFNRDYGVDLPTFDLRDETSLDQFFAEIEKIVDERGWKLIKEVSIGLLSFLKISMYHDLDDHRERLLDNSVVRAIIGDTEAVIDIPKEYRDFPYDDVDPLDWHQVVNADSSQQEAIMLSKVGVSFVMQGPPGTGKSQTITNIIAEALADKKKILFVSEKAAALEVVYKRLSEVNLDDFCLTLHSHKANKKDILEDIGGNLKLPRTTVKDSVIKELTQLFYDRNDLNQYATDLHAKVSPLEESIYTVFGKLSELYAVADIDFSIDDVATISSEHFRKMQYYVSSYATALSNLDGCVAENPWHGTIVTDSSQAFQNIFKAKTDGFNDLLSSLSKLYCEYVNRFGIQASNTWNSHPRIFLMTEQLLRLPLFPDSWYSKENREKLLKTASEFNNSKDQYEDALIALHKVFRDEILDEDLISWISSVDESLTKISAFSIYADIPFDELFSNVDLITENSEHCIKLLERISTQVESAARVLELNDLNDTLEEAVLIAKVLNEIVSSGSLKREWFDPIFFKQTENILNLAKEHRMSLKEKRRALFPKWEQDVMTIDCDSMLQRFKTDYAGFFKVFKSAYHADVKVIRGMSKLIGAKLSDDAIIILLQELKLIHAEEQWFRENESALRTCVGDYFLGQNTDWHSIELAFATSVDIGQLFSHSSIPLKIIDIICDKITHSTEYAIFAEISNALQSDISKFLATLSADSKAKETLNTVSVRNELLPNYQSVKSAGKDILNHIEILQPYMVCRLGPEDNLYHQTKKANETAQLRKDILKSYDSNAVLFEERFDGLLTDWKSIINEINAVITFFEAFASTCTPELLEFASNNTSNRAEVNRILENLQNERTAANNQFMEFANFFEPEEKLADTDLAELIVRYQSCCSDYSALDKWLEYKETKNACDELGLEAFTKKIEHCNGFVGDITDAFCKRFYHLWLSSIVEKVPSIQQFRRRNQDERVERFTTVDEKQLAIAQVRIRENIINTFPDPNQFMSKQDEMGILKKELSKKSRIMPLRKLFREIPNLLLVLKPCLMMSPLSVAYFLEAEKYHFDMIIFDEASQIFPQDAIGAIFRGDQIIIAGDSNQLPPTKFFAASTNNDSEYDTDDETYEEEIYDSILEETAAILPNRTLRWHYRSKHEHLIAFSNQEIYKNELVTFPSSIEREQDAGVEFVFVEDGVYIGGGRNHNIPEAQRCVQLVQEHIRKYPKRSLGIIAFSEKQQQAISQKINEFREDNPEYEKFFTEDRDDEFFVKNLENVQGDERDTIIFSVCYARTKEQRENNKPMTLRFGPLGQQGGERRLNVAITRAKKNVKLVSSIRPGDIDLSRTESVGVRMLQAYIDFAMKGSVSLRATGSDTENDIFVDYIAEFIEANGYRIRKHVGCSGYKIDIAVEHPCESDCFVVGIECDGYSYSSAKTARDRDHLRKSVLESMGWNMYRVWTTEWFKNPKTEGGNLILFIINTINAYKNNADIAPKISGASPVDFTEIEEVVQAKLAIDDSVDPGNPYGFDLYKEADLLAYSRSTKKRNEFEMLKYVIGIEQPIALDLLYQRMAAFVGKDKTTSAVRAKVDQNIRLYESEFNIYEDKFVCLKGFTDIRARVPQENEKPRLIENISPQELGVAMITIASKAIGMQVEGLIHETIKALGYAKKGSRISKCMDCALEILTKEGRMVISNGKVNVAEVKCNG
jgi:very-short-patch-repair endonuclease